MSNTLKTCRLCGKAKKPVEFAGHGAVCRPCGQPGRQLKKLLETEVRVLRALRNNGMTGELIRQRLGRPCADRLPGLVGKGLAEEVGGFYALTPAGRAACPYRNTHLEAKRRRQQEEPRHARNLEQNEAISNRCLCLMNAVNTVSLLGVVVKGVELEARPVPIIWVYCAPALYRETLGEVIDIGPRHDGRVKSVLCLGCEVRWLEPMAMVMARRAARLGGMRHARH